MLGDTDGGRNGMRYPYPCPSHPHRAELPSLMLQVGLPLRVAMQSTSLPHMHAVAPCRFFLQEHVRRTPCICVPTSLPLPPHLPVFMDSYFLPEGSSQCCEVTEGGGGTPGLSLAQGDLHFTGVSSRERMHRGLWDGAEALSGCHCVPWCHLKPCLCCHTGK